MPFSTFLLCPSGPVTVRREGEACLAQDRQGNSLELTVPRGACRAALATAPAPAGAAQRLLLAALEFAFSEPGAPPRLLLSGAGLAPLAEGMLALGAAVPEPGAGPGALTAHAEMLWQIPLAWTAPRAAAAYPAMPVMSQGQRHPRRPPKPRGTFYARHIPWLDEVLSFRAAEMDTHLPLLHRWMNDPRVAEFWKEDGPVEHHRAYLQRLLDDPHMLPVFAYFNDEPFGYFELYWAKENRLAPFYDVADHDRGWHVVIGEDRFRGRARISAWLPSLMHAMFLDDPRTARIVGEPQADHHQQLRNLERSGFARIKTFDFPHKTAVLVSLLRETYFHDRLWLPREAEPAASNARREPAHA